MAVSQIPFTSDDVGACAAAAMVEIRTVLSRLTPAERADFWKAVRLSCTRPASPDPTFAIARSADDAAA